MAKPIDASYLKSQVLAFKTKILDPLFDKKQDVLTFDTTPTADSTNPVTSGGLKTYIDNHSSLFVSEENDKYISDAGQHCVLYYAIAGNKMTIMATQYASNDGKTISVKYPVAFAELPTITIVSGTPYGTEKTTVNTLTEWHYDQNYGRSEQNEMHFKIEGKITLD